MLLRAMLAFLVLPTVVAGVLPWGLSRLSGPGLAGSPYGWVPAAIGLVVLLSTVVSFYRRGQGTLAPWDPPRHLVVQDLFRFNRNPMYVGVIAIIAGWAIVSGSAWNIGYALLVPIIFHLRVLRYEEPELARLFGAEWERYRASVPRWGIRLTPWRDGH